MEPRPRRTAEAGRPGTRRAGMHGCWGQTAPDPAPDPRLRPRPCLEDRRGASRGAAPEEDRRGRVAGHAPRRDAWVLGPDRARPCAGSEAEATPLPGGPPRSQPWSRARGGPPRPGGRARAAPYQRISWVEQGRSFVVWKPVELARDLLPLHFKHYNFSFVRQLNTYVSTSKTHSSIYTSSVLLVTEIVVAKQRSALVRSVCLLFMSNETDGRKKPLDRRCQSCL
jgi:hypothetical protein